MTISCQFIAATLSSILAPHLVDPEGKAFWIYADPARAIVSINPHNVKSVDRVLSDQFAHHLSTALGGPRIERANTRGIFYQVGYTPVPPPLLASKPLDLSAQPNPLAIPIGETRNGPMWLSLTDLGSVLIGGSRRMGKSRFLHGWIQALLHGGETDLWLYDGKAGMEFDRYANQPNVRAVEDLAPALQELYKIANQRTEQLRAVSATSMVEYNERVPVAQRLRPICLIIDEAALVEPDAQATLARFVAWSGAHGIYPVLATQRTGADQIPPGLKTNLAIRIAFPVPAQADSRVILDRTGAEQLPKIPGRLLMVWGARKVEAQAYQVELPGGPAITPKDIALACWIRDQHKGIVSIPRLVAGQGMPERAARELLDEWQSRGWLLGGGQGVARRLSPALEAIICRSVEGRRSLSNCQSDSPAFPDDDPSVSIETEEE